MIIDFLEEEHHKKQVHTTKIDEHSFEGSSDTSIVSDVETKIVPAVIKKTKGKRGRPKKTSGSHKH